MPAHVELRGLYVEVVHLALLQDVLQLVELVDAPHEPADALHAAVIRVILRPLALRPLALDEPHAAVVRDTPRDALDERRVYRSRGIVTRFASIPALLRGQPRADGGSPRPRRRRRHLPVDTLARVRVPRRRLRLRRLPQRVERHRDRGVHAVRSEVAALDEVLHGDERPGAQPAGSASVHRWVLRQPAEEIAVNTSLAVDLVVERHAEQEPTRVVVVRRLALLRERVVSGAPALLRRRLGHLEAYRQLRNLLARVVRVPFLPAGVRGAHVATGFRIRVRFVHRHLERRLVYAASKHGRRHLVPLHHRQERTHVVRVPREPSTRHLLVFTAIVGKELVVLLERGDLRGDVQETVGVDFGPNRRLLREIGPAVRLLILGEPVKRAAA